MNYHSKKEKEMNKEYAVYICDYLEALPCNAQFLLVDKYQLDDLADIIKDNEKCLIVYPPNEVQDEK